VVKHQFSGETYCLHSVWSDWGLGAARSSKRLVYCHITERCQNTGNHIFKLSRSKSKETLHSKIECSL